MEIRQTNPHLFAVRFEQIERTKFYEQGVAQSALANYCVSLLAAGQQEDTVEVAELAYVCANANGSDKKDEPTSENTHSDKDTPKSEVVEISDRELAIIATALEQYIRDTKRVFAITPPLYNPALPREITGRILEVTYAKKMLTDIHAHEEALSGAYAPNTPRRTTAGF